jgi:hypothetical protein
MQFGLVVIKIMKILQNKFVRSLPKVILFLLAFYNFVWTYLETLDPMAGRGIAAAWYSTKDFPMEPFLFVVSSYLLFIPRRWSYALSFIISGYLSINWVFLLGDYFYKMSQTFREYLSRLQIDDYNPLTVWESQAVLATAIFILATYSFIKELTTKRSKPLL